MPERRFVRKAVETRFKYVRRYAYGVKKVGVLFNIYMSGGSESHLNKKLTSVFPIEGSRTEPFPRLLRHI
jgi:hypothetical protein